MTLPMIQQCHVYFRRGRVFVQPFHRIYGGPLYVGGEEVVESVPLPSEVGREIGNALAQSHDIIHLPEDIKSLQSAVLKLAGVRSWSSLVKGAKCVSIQLDGRNVAITFMHPKGSSFVSNNSDDVVLAFNEVSVGRAVLEFFETA